MSLTCDSIIVYSMLWIQLVECDMSCPAGGIWTYINQSIFYCAPRLNVHQRAGQSSLSHV